MRTVAGIAKEAFDEARRSSRNERPTLERDEEMPVWEAWESLVRP